MDEQSQLRFWRLKGDLLFRWGHYPEAGTAFLKASSLVEPVSSLSFELLVRMAQSHLLSHDFLSAQKILQDVNPSDFTVTDEKWLIRFHFARGFCSWHRGNSDRTDLDRAFGIAEKLEDYDSLANGYRQRAELALREGSLTEANSLARRAIGYANKTRNAEERGYALKILGSIAWRKSRYDLAEKRLRKSIHAFHSTGNPYGMAEVWSVLGNVYSEQYRFSSAVRCFQKAIHNFSGLNHQLEVSLAQFNLATAYVEKSRIREAESIFLRCLEVDKKGGNKRFYAYDLRALAVVCILRAFYRKARRLLIRSLEIYEELHAEGDILQTKLILLLNELEQEDYKKAKPLVDSLQNQIHNLGEPRTEAEIRYLSGIYFAATGDLGRAKKECCRSIRVSRRIGYFKLIAKNLIQKMLFRKTVPEPGSLDLRKTVRYFRLSRNKLDEGLQLLKLFQAYPELLCRKENSKKVRQMKLLFRRAGNRSCFQNAQKLLEKITMRHRSAEPSYSWWQSILRIIGSEETFQIKISQVLNRLCQEFHTSVSSIHYMNEHGIYERMTTSEEIGNASTVDLQGQVLDRVLKERKALRLDCNSDPMLDIGPSRKNPISVIAIPVYAEDQINAVWYLERHQPEPFFAESELEKATFFGAASAPALQDALRAHLLQSAKEGSNGSHSFDDMIGNSTVMRNLYRQIEKLAPVDISVLITGESGTGKELIARSLHKKSRRTSGPFRALNCSALPETLIESELFGYSRGAFTGAASGKPGLIEQAHGGTFFLDEVGDLSVIAQAKLLRVIQEREVQRLGETVTRKIDVRFLFATHKDLKKMAGEGLYREDLFYRISTSMITVPPLRERSDDVRLLTNHLMEKYSVSFQKQKIRLSPAVMKILSLYSWPGNVRELENVIQGILVSCESNSFIEPKDLPAHLNGNRQVKNCSGMSLEEAKQNFEREFLEHALIRNRWNKTHTAGELKITRQGLIHMIQRLGIKEPKR